MDNEHINNAKQIEDNNRSEKNWTADANTDMESETETETETVKDTSIGGRHPSGDNIGSSNSNSNGVLDDNAVVKGHIDGVHSTKTALSSSSSLLLSSSSTNATTAMSTSRQERFLNKDLLAVESAHHKDFATSESGRKRKKNLSDSTTVVVSESTLQGHPALSSSNVAIALSSSSSMPSSAVEAVAEPKAVVEQDRHLKRIKVNHVGEGTSTALHAPVDLATHSSNTGNGRERKRRLSDDLVTPIMSGTSTPGRHSASPSRSAVSVSTPSSSVPAVSVSPVAAQGSMEQEHHLKRPRVYNVDDDSDNDAPVTGAHHQYGPIIIDDDEDDENGDAVSDRASNQADYDTSFTGQDDSVINLSVSVEGDAENREPSPTGSVDSDATITQSRVHARATSVNSSAAVRASSVERQAEPATSPRQDFSRSSSIEPRSFAPQTAPTVHTIDDDPDTEEVIEVIDLTPQPRFGSYPRGDSLARVPGLSPQHSFQLPTLQRLVSRSSQSVERSQTRPTNRSPNNSIDILEIPDDNDDEDDDFYGRDTVRIDSEVREVQLDPRHPWSRGPIQLILPAEDRLELEDQSRPQIEDVVDVDDHLPAVDYAEIESDSEDDDARGSQEVEDDGVNDRQVDEEVNYILNLRRDSTSGAVVSRRVTPMPLPRVASQRSFPARSPPSFNMRSPSEQHQPLPSGASTPGRNQSHSQPAATTKATTAAVMTARTATQRRLSSSTESTSGSWVSQHLKCSICMDTMNVPTMLRCGHAFCRACIHMALNVARHCPMCRHPTTKTRLQELEFHIGGGSSHPVGAASE
ncbi:hypothetical protein BGX24_010878 [Mortierella sp. AD032]|nr:hypothetical protein BGX24_010878 [Mortierella sp. AD032]